LFFTNFEQKCTMEAHPVPGSGDEPCIPDYKRRAMSKRVLDLSPILT
jgi:hypothetical protein